MTVSRRDLLKTAAAGVALSSASCGWILYPERKGRSGGNIDTTVFVIDLLWLLPGILPGVVCLAVDFSTGCVYRSGSVAQAAPHDAGATVTVNDAVVAKSAAQTAREVELVWSAGVDLEEVKKHGELVFEREDGSLAKAKIRDLI